MPEDIYYLAKVLSPSFVTGQTQRISGTGAYDIKPRKRLTVNQKILYSVPDPSLLTLKGERIKVPYISGSTSAQEFLTKIRNRVIN